jgi:hypothetical protein
VAELDGAVCAQETDEPRAGGFAKATVIAIVLLQVAWSSALVLFLTSVIR